MIQMDRGMLVDRMSLASLMKAFAMSLIELLNQVQGSRAQSRNTMYGWSIGAPRPKRTTNTK